MCRNVIEKHIRDAELSTDASLRFFVLLTALTHCTQIVQNCETELVTVAPFVSSHLVEAWENFFMGTDSMGQTRCVSNADARFTTVLDFVARAQTEFVSRAWL
jgi:hypothetical protein